MLYMSKYWGIPSLLLFFPLSLHLYLLLMLSLLCQGWISDFGVCESVNVHTGVAWLTVCWASHALIVCFQGCAYTQWIMRQRVCVCVYLRCSCRSIKLPEGLLRCPILLRQDSLSFLKGLKKWTFNCTHLINGLALLILFNYQWPGIIYFHQQMW